MVRQGRAKAAGVLGEEGLGLVVVEDATVWRLEEEQDHRSMGRRLPAMTEAMGGKRSMVPAISYRGGTFDGQRYMDDFGGFPPRFGPTWGWHRQQGNGPARRQGHGRQQLGQRLHA